MDSKKAIIIVSMLVGIGFIAVALVIGSKKSEQPTPSLQITKQQLQDANGKDGKPCYVALDNIVYEIKQGNKWQNGEHTTSEGQAYCGMDGTEVIKKSPHGKSVLSLLTKVGTLQQ